MSARLIESITDLSRKVAFRDLGWSAALAAAHRMLPAETLVVLRQAIATLGDRWAEAVFQAAQRELHEPQEVWVDDLTEVGELIAPGLTAAQLHQRLGAAIAADPDVGAMRVIAGAREVMSMEVGRTREPPVDDADYVLVLRDR